MCICVVWFYSFKWVIKSDGTLQMMYEEGDSWKEGWRLLAFRGNERVHVCMLVNMLVWVGVWMNFASYLEMIWSNTFYQLFHCTSGLRSCLLETTADRHEYRKLCQFIFIFPSDTCTFPFCFVCQVKVLSVIITLSPVVLSLGLLIHHCSSLLQNRWQNSSLKAGA